MSVAQAMDIEAMLAFDREHLWHPYTSMIDPLPVYPVDSACGVRIRLADGRELIDGMASWWSAIHGYAHPVLVRTLQEQAARLSHVMFGGLTHRPAVQLAERLIGCSPAGLDKVFLCDSGSVAVEVAMKMAMQYQHARGRKNKKRFLTIRGGYHGDTFHAMAVCDPVTGMHALYRGVLPEFLFAPRPASRFAGQYDSGAIADFAALLAANSASLCAVILEPIVQGAGGMYFYHPEYLREVRRLCHHHDVLLIADEIATGFGRSGELFACDHAAISPDILCVGKALTGGCLSLAAVLATAEVGWQISAGEPHVFMHGPTFMGNPLACSVAVASIDLLLQSDWRGNIARIERGLQRELSSCAHLAQVDEVRVLGAIGVVELHRAVEMAIIQERFVSRGVWVRPFGRLVYVMPPYCITDSELATLCQAICEVVKMEPLQ
ncbi:MAG: adenosylmethionine--8-amino-7-oxononanoate transaminase [Desulfopila sp.]